MNTTTTESPTPSAADFLAGEGWEIRASSTLAQLEAVRPLVAHIVATGIFPDSRATAAAITWVATLFPGGENEAATQQHAIALVERLLPAGEDRDIILSAIRDDAEDMAQARGDAGYLLGVAVGQQIGSDAFRNGSLR
jgi:hypothetical protein